MTILNYLEDEKEIDIPKTRKTGDQPLTRADLHEELIDVFDMIMDNETEEDEDEEETEEVGE